MNSTEAFEHSPTKSLITAHEIGDPQQPTPEPAPPTVPGPVNPEPKPLHNPELPPTSPQEPPVPEPRMQHHAHAQEVRGRI